ncbi:putative dehydrogenase [Paenibacillus phyllosphaerae]|uniref:Putative dehydrogenase n=1 Tax=Paenibacillus phyllosphaerae TaxID=274593 RepID=A0A7W5FRM0_9BACL|nr:Gfo/Idh/MocA family oxidoreductase [Paenibacillus phyllosphaerae]MBB3114493.1 putative dehydrogenase [Paenibacillus phyllosphaerae]
MQPVKIGIMGCGMISGIYLHNCTAVFDNLEVKAVADLVPELAAKRAAEFNVPYVYTAEEMLSDPEIEIIVNLTAPHVHAAVNKQILEAGKHVYTEKPFALTREDADDVLALAEAKGLRVGSAPDTFLGGSLQTCRKLIDDGWIGTPYAASGSIIMGHAWDGSHPNIAALMKLGWDPLFDMAPYYFTAMVNLLGPVRRVAGYTGSVRSELAITNPRAPRYGDTIPVEAPMNTAAVLQFESGVIATMQAAKESFGYAPQLVIYGTEGTLFVPDPNNFDGEIRILQRSGELATIPYTHGFTANSRGIGVADLAQAIRSGRPHRASGQLARHVIDITIGIMESSNAGVHVDVSAAVDRPAALPLGLQYNLLDN